MMRPTGWFQIGWSKDFAAGAIVSKAYFGEEIVVVRGSDGVVRAIDAFCGHMGAHLAWGGVVNSDGCINCPFHGWDWNLDGENVNIPYQDRPNRAVRMRTWPLREINGVVYMWHDRSGGPPSWEPPDVFTGLGIVGRAFHDCDPLGQVRFGRKQLTPYVVLDNAADAAHFMTVHQSGLPIVVSSEPDGHLMRVKLGFGASWVNSPETATGDALEILGAGVGLSYTALGGKRSPFVVILLSTTPIDGDSSEMFQTVWLEKADGDELNGRLESRMHHATHQLPRDIEIWEHQRYVQRPAFAASEVRGFTALRKWAANFYEAQATEAG